MTDSVDPEEFFRAEDAAARDHAGKPNGRDAGGRRRFKPVRFKEITLNSDPPYRIKGLLPREGLAVVWGPPKCGKSFWVFDMMLHVASGWQYRDRKTMQGTVVYIACEGERGLGARAEAFRQAKLKGEDPPFFLLTTRLDLVADVDQLIVDIRDAIGADHCADVVIDTLNRSIAGSESRDEDMGNYVKAADKLREAFGGLVILIHHCGINGERPRGHTSLTGAADVQIAVKRDDRDEIIATVEWLKDGPEGDVIASRLRVVKIGLDDDGGILTSCVVEPAEYEGPVKGTKPAKRLSDGAKIALDTLRKAIDEAGEAAPGSNHIPLTARVVSVETWRPYHYAGTASDGRNKDARKIQFQRDRKALQSAHVVGLHDDLVWIIPDA